MKHCPFAVTVLLLLVSISYGSCVHHDTKKISKQVRRTTKESSPGTIPTSETSYFMKARIDGKQWMASHMMPDEDINSSYIRIHGENEGDYINFQLWKKGVEPGKKFSFDHDHAATLSLEDDAGFWGGTSGEVMILKLDGKWMEGTFAFKATSSSSSKTIKVSDGSFRVPFSSSPAQ